MFTGLFLGKPRRGMLRRAVFSDYQRKGLEKRFQVQKYISKPDRKKLAEKLGLKDSQVSDQRSNTHKMYRTYIFATSKFSFLHPSLMMFGFKKTSVFATMKYCCLTKQNSLYKRD